MSQTEYLILGISIVVFLLAIFVVSFVLFMKTPAPKGCEDIKISEENCSKCGKTECAFYKKAEEEK